MNLARISLRVCVQAWLGYASASVAFAQQGAFERTQKSTFQRIPADSDQGNWSPSKVELPHALVHADVKAAKKANTPKPNLAPTLGSSIFVLHPDAYKTPSPTTKVESEDVLLAEAERLLQEDLLGAEAARPKTAPVVKLQETIQPQEKYAAAPEARQTHEQRRIIVSEVKGQLNIQPRTLDLGLDSERAVGIKFKKLKELPQIFVRDPKKIQWNEAERSFTALAKGKTEIFLVYKGKMHILSATVAEHADLLATDGSFQELDSVLPKQAYGNYYNKSDVEREIEVVEEAPAEADADSDAPRDLSIAETSLETQKSVETETAKQNNFVYQVKGRKKADIAIQVMGGRSDAQVMNSRSDAIVGKIYPMDDVTIQLWGTGVQAKTDATGIARFGDLPVGSRFWTIIGDEEGRIVPTANEVVISAKSPVYRVKTLSYETYTSYTNVAGTSQNWAYGSLCADIVDGTETPKGIDVQISDEKAQGPFFFSEFGLQPGQRETGENGRFCFFNVSPGLREISFFHGNEFISALSLPIFPGAHTEEVLPLSTHQGKQFYLASMSGAMDQLYGDDATAKTMDPVSYANVIAIGENQALQSVTDNVLGHPTGYTDFKGRIYTLVKTAEFENTLMAEDQSRTPSGYLPVLPVLQRGFVEDLFNELNQNTEQGSVAYNPSLGQVLVYHYVEDANTQVQISLIDSYGRVFDQGWYFGAASQGQVKSAFFNLNPGMYTVKVTRADGSIIALDTVAADFWTTGVVQTGGKMMLALDPDIDQ